MNALHDEDAPLSGKSIGLKAAVEEYGSIWDWDPFLDTASNLAENVRRLLRRKGLTVRGLAERSGISERGLHNILGQRSNVSLKSVVLLSEVLGSTPAELLTPPIELERRAGKSGGVKADVVDAGAAGAARRFVRSIGEANRADASQNPGATRPG